MIQILLIFGGGIVYEISCIESVLALFHFVGFIDGVPLFAIDYARTAIRYYT